MYCPTDLFLLHRTPALLHHQDRLFIPSVTDPRPTVVVPPRSTCVSPSHTMADDAATSTEDTQVTFNVKAANDQKHVLTLPTSTTVADVKAKLSTPEFVDLPAERQRLIYSGRVLKDHDTLSGVKIKDGHTVHLVKGAASNARQNPANSGSSTEAGGAPVSQVPTNIAAGTGNNPLAGLTGARYAGFHGLPSADMFGADGGVSL